MKIGIQTWGSDGDILPFLALAEGLQAAGHQVTVAYTSVDNKDYSVYSISGGFNSFRAFDTFTVGMNEAMDAIVETNDPMKQFMFVMEKFFNPAVEAMYQASHKLCAENDIVIGHMMNHTLLTAAEKTGCPRVVVALAPLAIRTKYIPLFGPNLGSFLNPLTWMLGDYAGRKKLFSLAEKIRRRAGLPPLESMQKQLYESKELTLIASSPTLTVRRQDWGDHIQICGDLNFRASDRHIPVPEGMEEFISSGAPPIYMTFGSLAPFRSEQTDQIMSDAVEKAGCRAVIQSVWSGRDSPHIFRCSQAPHAKVFPHCSAVVHHGGAGTTHSSLRAGRPSIVVEHAFDQIFWGSELQRIGAGGKVLHRNTLTADQLANAIKATLDSSEMKNKANQPGGIMQREDGVKTAVELIEKKFQAQN
ncbi:glycosyltransferase [Collimonas antrihumi]|uniref:glycosyltransferase n=1 Tax=Collimonas antrihumi TaxID=1940615 RepID=UPI001B8D3783|nr:glycosyltransferase [Collimonas antrihumi]